MAGLARPQTRPKTEPRPSRVAETRLLMEGINQPNFQGLEHLLRKKPAEADAWTFARGQALLIAENANLLMLRPPRERRAGTPGWNGPPSLRESATTVARAAANRDYEGSRAGLAELANVCNRCHQTFRVSVRVTPFADESSEPKAPGQRPTAPVP